MTLKYDFEDYDFEYELEQSQIIDFLVDYLLRYGDFDNTSTNRKIIEFMIDYTALADDSDLLDDLKDEMTDYFKEEAEEYFKDAKYRNDNPLEYVGMSIHDFINIK